MLGTHTGEEGQNLKYGWTGGGFPTVFPSRIPWLGLSPLDLPWAPEQSRESCRRSHLLLARGPEKWTSNSKRAWKFPILFSLSFLCILTSNINVVRVAPLTSNRSPQSQNSGGEECFCQFDGVTNPREWREPSFFSDSPTTALWHRRPKWLILSFLVRGPKGGPYVCLWTHTHPPTGQVPSDPLQRARDQWTHHLPGPDWPLGGAQAGQIPMAALTRLEDGRTLESRPTECAIGLGPDHKQVNWPLNEKHQHSPRILEKTWSLST